MTENVLTHGTVGDVITRIEAIRDPEDGLYVLYAPAGITNIREEMEAAIILEPDWQEEDDPLTEFALEHSLEPACEIALAQRIIVAAKRQKPEVTVSELVAALNHYLAHDAFMNFKT